MTSGVTNVSAEVNVELMKKMLEFQKDLMKQLIEGSLSNTSQNINNSVHSGQIINLLV